MSTNATIAAVREALSTARMSTYEAAAQVTDATDPSALELYAWNAQVSGALLPPLHVCEVVIRNAVDEVLSTVYGHRWPWSQGFEQSLPRSRPSPLRDLNTARARATTTGQVIPELSFVFWQRLFTRRYDQRLWDPYFRQVFPNTDATQSVAQLREHIYRDLGGLRKLRNRIAHHEPIFTRNLSKDLQTIFELVSFRCGTTAHWLSQYETASATIAAKPVLHGVAPAVPV